MIYGNEEAFKVPPLPYCFCDKVQTKNCLCWPANLCCLLVTAHNEVGARLCFYRCVWFCSQGGSTWPGTPPGTRYNPPGPVTPPWDQVHPWPGTPLGPGTPPQDQVHIPPTRYTPQDQVHPLDQVHPPDQVHPLDQVHTPRTSYTPWTSYTFLGPGTPPTRYTPGTRYTPQTRYTPPDQVHPPGTRYTPPGPGTPWAQHAGRYGLRAGGRHPTGMQSCWVCSCTFIWCYPMKMWHLGGNNE